MPLAGHCGNYRYGHDVDPIQARPSFEHADPEVVITLGNAAAQVFAAILGIAGAPGSMRPVNYGSTIAAPDEWTWWPLAHPGAVRSIPTWTKAHAEWKRSISQQGRPLP